MTLKAAATGRVEDLSDLLLLEIDEELLPLFDIVHLSGKQVLETELKTGHYPLDGFADRLGLQQELYKIGKGLSYTVNHAIRHSILTGKNYSPNKTNCLDYQAYTGKSFAEEKPESFDTLVLGIAKDVRWGERWMPTFVHVEKGKKLGKIYFSPANRFSSIRTEAKKGYAFAYELEYGIELMCETNFLVVIENPEYIYKGEKK